MTITQSYQKSNAASAQAKNTINIGSGNIVPHWWYKVITGTGGKPDLVSITLLSELLFLHRKTSGKEFNDGYIYFERKFPNELHLKLNIDRLVAIMPVSINSNDSSDNDQGDIFSNDMLGNYSKGSSGNSGEHISNN